MAITKQFLRCLDEALERRTEYLRSLVVPRVQGAPQKYTKKIRDRLKKKLLNAATEALVRDQAEDKFSRTVEKWRLRFIAGFGIQDRLDTIYW